MNIAKPDKPIFSQPGGGRGKLFAPMRGGTYMGTYQMPDGKTDRRMFNCANNGAAIKAYRDWCEGMDARMLEAMEAKVRPKAAKPSNKEKPVTVQQIQKEGRADMANTADARYDKMQDKIYVVQVVGGVSITWCETLDKAVAVCDALTKGAKASGFAAIYDVVEVEKWKA